MSENLLARRVELENKIGTGMLTDEEYQELGEIEWQMDSAVGFGART